MNDIDFTEIKNFKDLKRENLQASNDTNNHELVRSQ
jgi:hypothetical protein